MCSQTKFGGRNTHQFVWTECSQMAVFSIDNNTYLGNRGNHSCQALPCAISRRMRHCLLHAKSIQTVGLCQYALDTRFMGCQAYVKRFLSPVSRHDSSTAPFTLLFLSLQEPFPPLSFLFFKTQTKMANPYFTSHTALSDGLLAEFRKLPQKDGKIMAEYVWIGGSGQDLRCKTRTLSKKPSTPADL